MSTRPDTTEWRSRPARRGISLPLTMVALSTTLVVTLSFVRTQTTLLQIGRNTSRADAALQAAITGANVAFREIQSPDWAGVTSTPAETLSSDSYGTTSYAVTFSAVTPATTGTVLQMVIRSTGRWQDAADDAHVIERVVESVVELRPRLPGRTVTAVDDAGVDDVAANPGDYDEIRDYAVFANGIGNSLTLDPNSRVDGRIWLEDDLRFYTDPRWDSSIRRAVLQSIGSTYVSGGRPSPPHPFGRLETGGDYDMRFRQTPSSSTQTDLADMNVTWTRTTQTPTLPTIDTDWTTYRLYEGGFEYSATAIPNLLNNVDLGPTADNPLGIYRAAGSVSVWNTLTLRGTLIVPGTLFLNDDAQIASFDGRLADGTPLLPSAEGWPRLPAIVAGGIVVSRDARTSIDGAVILDRFWGAGGEYELEDVPAVDLSGTARAELIDPPRSLVALEGSQFKNKLEAIDGTGRYSIRLGDDAFATWYPIVGVDAAEGTVTVAGEAEFASPVAFVIGPTRMAYFDLRGPLVGAKHDVYRPNNWVIPDSSSWSDFERTWDDQREAQNGTASFMDWLADPSNFTSWAAPIDTYGLTIEPTFQVRHADGSDQHWAPPLFDGFRAASDLDPLAAHAGYRWEILDWRIVP